MAVDYVDLSRFFDLEKIFTVSKEEAEFYVNLGRAVGYYLSTVSFDDILDVYTKKVNLLSLELGLALSDLYDFFRNTDLSYNSERFKRLNDEIINRLEGHQEAGDLKVVKGAYIDKIRSVIEDILYAEETIKEGKNLNSLVENSIFILYDAISSLGNGIYKYGDEVLKKAVDLGYFSELDAKRLSSYAMGLFEGFVIGFKEENKESIAKTNDRDYEVLNRLGFDLSEPEDMDKLKDILSQIEEEELLEPVKEELSSFDMANSSNKLEDSLKFLIKTGNPTIVKLYVDVRTDIKLKNEEDLESIKQFASQIRSLR